MQILTLKARSSGKANSLWIYQAVANRLATAFFLIARISQIRFDNLLRIRYTPFYRDARSQLSCVAWAVGWQ